MSTNKWEIEIDQSTDVNKDFSGVKFMLVEAKEMCNLHHQLKSAKGRIVHLEKRVGFFCGMSEDQVKTMRGDYARLQENLAAANQRISNMEWSVKNAESVKAALSKEIIDLKAKLYDKVQNP